MTPQELIDMPGYGSAEKELRRQGRWMYTDKEKLQMVYDKFRSAYSDIGDAMDELEAHT